MGAGRLPIHAIETRLFEALQSGPVVVSSPTGSGKSTEVPRWCAEQGRVLVVEPRRVACRSLAQRVAFLEQTALGKGVGYSVRDDHRYGKDTAIVFATPGIVLRMLQGTGVSDFATIVVDEFHERTLETDLILALLNEHQRLIVMSATLDGDKVAAHLNGTHVHAPGRQHPVEHHYVGQKTVLPSVKGVEERVIAALDASQNDPGDVLVFLPGKAEIRSVARRLEGRSALHVVPLHGGLSLNEQSQAFESHQKRRVILATNVAETSLTLPGIGVVIDSGLVRRTRYHAGRGYLTLMPVAQDSADQRAGRAGRTGPGVCYRLWDKGVRLEAHTPPEIFRESIAPMLLAAAACGSRLEDLPLLDPAKPHSIEAATDELHALGAVTPDGAITDRGQRLFGLPLQADLGRLLVEAENTPAMEDAVDLVAVLTVERPLFVGQRPDDPEDDLRSAGCDASAFVKALRGGNPAHHGLNAYALKEARAASVRLRKAFGLGKLSDVPFEQERIARLALAADPRCAHVARKRKRFVAWSNGGTEVELGRDSAINEEDVSIIAVMGTRALGVGARDTRVIITCGIPLKAQWLISAGMGRDRLAAVSIEKGRLLAKVERVYARRVLKVREECPEGDIARDALCDLFLRGSLFSEVLTQTQERVESFGLCSRLSSAGYFDDSDKAVWDEFERSNTVLPLREWVISRLVELGVESGADLALLEPHDLLAPALPEWLERPLNKNFPRELSVGDAAYQVEYDLTNSHVILHQIRGSRTELPDRAWLPRFQGFSIKVERRGKVRLLRP